ncbi:acyl-CoA dehydrogenase family protein [Hazenella sp. IB182357]|uniref:Acyl-CoA dehydrogenase family protein n=1 Tax=Polycladospora coralii TaxID=2771432 RepID=A0A926RUE0_9BACL|nr:acyl-CoA dehydrogenase family protein [Polycladospora coralii]MBD1372853.1 acyl-CoA dehydrogenase family protein [Polycladospora coralii]
MYTDRALRELEETAKSFAQTFRKLGLEIDQNPAAINQYLHLEEIRIFSKQIIPEAYNNEPIVTSTKEKFYGITCLERVIAFEQLAYGDMGVVLACPGASLSGIVMYDLGSKAQQEKYYTRLLEKPTWTFFALSERNKGSDATAIETHMTHNTLNGEKYLIGNGTRADFGLVFTRKTSGPLGIEIVWIEKDAVGFQANPLNALGLKGAMLSHLKFDQCAVHDDAIIGHHLKPTRRGLWGAIQTFNRMRPGVAAAALGIAQATYDYVMAHRKQFSESEKTRLSYFEQELQAVRAVIRQGAEALDHDPNQGHLASIGKVKAVRLAESITAEALGWMGAGAFFEHPYLNKWYRDARACEYMEGTTNIQKLNIFQNYMNRKMAHV